MWWLFYFTSIPVSRIGFILTGILADYLRQNKRSKVLAPGQCQGAAWRQVDLAETRENEYGSDNVQVIQLNERNLIIDKPIEVFQVQELLTYFWFEKMKMSYNAEIHIATEPDQKVQINGEDDRTIGNLKISLIEKGSLKNGQEY